MSVMFQQELPVYRSVDVVVVGAGPAGIGAAVAAARNGAKTLIFEAHGCIGGMGTSGMVSPFMTSYDAPCDKMIIRGVFEELVNRMVEIGGAIDPKDVRNEQPYASYFHIGHNNVTPFDPHAFKLIGMRMLRESGAELLLQTQFVNVIKDGDRITGVARLVKVEVESNAISEEEFLAARTEALEAQQAPVADAEVVAEETEE